MNIAQHEGAPCFAGQLRTERPTQLEGETGEHNDLIALTNVGPHPCWVSGVPHVTAYTRVGQPLPFREGAGHYVTAKPANVVLLPPAASAYVLIAKYRCDEMPSTEVYRLQLTLPQGGHVEVPLPTGTGAGVLEYCRAPLDNAGRYLAVSPLTAEAATTQGWND